MALVEENGPGLYKLLLEVHDVCASFWEHIGSAIDNLALCFQDSIPALVKKNARESLMKKYDDIAYAYNRRTQFIHSRIVPTTYRHGVVQLMVRSKEKRARITKECRRRIGAISTGRHGLVVRLPVLDNVDDLSGRIYDGVDPLPFVN